MLRYPSLLTYHTNSYAPIHFCSFGPTSEEVGNTLVSLGRAHIVGGATEAVEDCLQRAYSVFSSLYDQYHERAISCKVHV